MSSISNLKQRELAEFLVRAKRATYAGRRESKEKELKDGDKEFSYEEKEKGVRYRDRYFGFNPFIGEEIVWSEGIAIWGMNYRGLVASKSLSTSKVYQFLRETLRQVEIELPMRGPSRFQAGKYRYQNEVKGQLNSFSGIERILYAGRVVYTLRYHGGSVGASRS